MSEDLCAKVDGLVRLMDERDRHYRELRVTDQKAVDAAFAASQKALDASEKAQTSYNEHTNQLRDTFYPRREAEQRIDGMEREIAGLRESRSEGKGRSDQSVWLVGVALALLTIAMRFVGD